jgi:hypothetical protein
MAQRTMTIWERSHWASLLVNKSHGDTIRITDDEGVMATWIVHKYGAEAGRRFWQLTRVTP